ncbi:MAG: LiaF transmembrane domain-containing protein [Thermoanaerobaculia bacterium]
MNNEAAFRITPRLIIGFGILAIGMLWTLDNLDVLESEPITRWWAAILVIIGVVQFFDRRANRLAPIVLVGIGTLLLLDEAYVIDFDLGDLIPLAIALLGAKLIWEAVTRRRGRSAEAVGDSDSVIHAFAMMGGVKRQSTSREFRGGDANAIMAGVELDLRNAQIRDGDDVIIDAFAMWGAVEIKVPPHWRVVGNVLPIMGAFEDHTHPTGETGPTLTIRGTAIMGGIDVKN